MADSTWSMPADNASLVGQPCVRLGRMGLRGRSCMWTREVIAMCSSRATISPPALTLVGAIATDSPTVLKPKRHDGTTTPQQFSKALSYQQLRRALEWTQRTTGAGIIGQQIALARGGRLRGCPQ